MFHIRFISQNLDKYAKKLRKELELAKSDEQYLDVDENNIADQSIVNLLKIELPEMDIKKALDVLIQKVSTDGKNSIAAKLCLCV